MDSPRWNPGRYEARASFVPRLALDLVDLLDARPGERVLDLGCGTGTLTARIAASGARVVGVDGSPEMIEAAREREPALTFAIADGQALSFAGEFDAVFSNAALHWMPRAPDVAAGVARSLKPGGRFVAEFGGEGCLDRFLGAVSAALSARGEDPRAWTGWYFPPLAEYVGILTAAGLDVRLAHRFDRPTLVEGSDGLREWLRVFRPRLEAVLGDGWTGFVRDVEERCLPLRCEQGWMLDYVRLRIVSSKRRVYGSVPSC